MRRSALFPLTALWILAFLPAPLFSQAVNARLSGVVSDPSNAAIPDVQVTARETKTGVVSKVKTNDLGIYRFETLAPGLYDLQLEKQGFQTVSRPGIQLSVGSVLAIDFKLEVGSVATAVTVEGGAPLVETTSTTLSSYFGERRIEDLPINASGAARNVYDLITTQAGTTPSGANANDAVGPHVHGARAAGSNYQLDGADDNQRQKANGNQFSVPIPVEAVGEFRVLTNNFNAEYGHNVGFVANAVTKSGTNELHGSLWEFLRNDVLDAKDASAQRTSSPKAALRQNTYGASVGGPVLKDHMFFFFAWERYRRGSAYTDSVAAPTKEFIDGMPSGFAKDIMQKYYGGFTPVQDFVDFYGSWAVDPVKKTGYSKTERSDPGFPHPQWGTAFYGNSNEIKSNNYVGKIDHVFNGGKDRIFGRYAFFDNPNQTLYGGGIKGNTLDPFLGGQNFILSHTHNIGASMLHEFRFAYNRYVNKVEWPFGQSLGLPQINASNPTYGQQYPSFTVPGFGDPDVTRNWRENTFQWVENFSYIRGRHNMKYGFEFRRNRDGTVGGGGSAPEGVLAFADAISFSNNIPLQVTLSVDPAASAKDPSGRIVPGTVYRGWRQNELSWFAQDEFKASRRLTLTFGIRYDYFAVPHNFRPELDSNFYFDAAKIGEGVFRSTSDNTGSLQGHFWAPDKNNFAPRFGFAFDPLANGRWSIRGGVGVAYDRLINNQFEGIKNNLPSSAILTLRNDWANNKVYVPTVKLPIVDGIAPGTPVSSLPGAAKAVDGNLRTTYYYNAFLGVQHQFASNFVFEVNTVWNAGHKLGFFDYFNRLPNAHGRTLNQYLSDDVFASNYRSNSLNSHYNAFELKLEKRWSHGLQFQSNYTWAHSLDAFSAVYTGSQGFPGLVDFGNWKLDFGNSDFDIRHRWSSTFNWEIPWLKNASPVVRGVLSGWTLNGIFSFSTGTPFSLIEFVDDPNGDGWIADFMSYVGTGKPANGIMSNAPIVKGGVQYLDPAQFTFTGSFSSAGHPGQNKMYGNAGRNQIYGPGSIDNALGLHKNFRLKERATLQFRSEFFNPFNHPNLQRVASFGGAADFSLFSDTFGQSYWGGGRNIQLALKLQF